MATLEERVQALETLLSAASGTAPYNSSYTGPQIDSAVSRALPGGTLEALIAEKAPNGFGSGETSGKRLTAADDLNAQFKGGWYYWTAGSIPANAPNVSNGAMEVIPFSNAITVQKYYQFGHSKLLVFVAIRQIWGDQIGEWEWDNPEMALGVEYRTTERYRGKPVYVKAIDFGALPNSGDRRISIEEGNSNIVAIRCCGVLNNGVNIPGVDVNDSSSANPIQCWAVSASIWISVPYDASHRTAVVTVWYYKTDD